MGVLVLLHGNDLGLCGVLTEGFGVDGELREGVLDVLPLRLNAIHKNINIILGLIIIKEKYTRSWGQTTNYDHSLGVSDHLS